SPRARRGERRGASGSPSPQDEGREGSERSKRSLRGGAARMGRGSGVATAAGNSPVRPSGFGAYTARPAGVAPEDAHLGAGRGARQYGRRLWSLVHPVVESTGCL